VARRRGTSSTWAGEDGGLFVLGDGVTVTFDWEAGEVYPDARAARRAWPAVRRRTWEHETRETVFPPASAAYDGLTSRVDRRGFNGCTVKELGGAALVDLAGVARFLGDLRRERIAGKAAGLRVQLAVEP